MRALKVLEQGDREAVDPARRLATVKAAVRETHSLAARRLRTRSAISRRDARPLFLHRARRRHPAAFRADARARRAAAGLPPSPFSRTRVQRVHRRDARSAGAVLDDRRRADRQQSQHPVGAHHDAHQRYRAGRVPRVASDGRGVDGAGRGALAAGRARPRARHHRPAGYRGAGRRRASRAECADASSSAACRPK